jgi:hypothetical protein
MRRVLATALLGAALFAAAACGNNNDDGGDDNGANEASPTPGAATGSEDTCAAIEETMGEFQTELVTAAAALTTAAESGDEAALEAAATDLVTVAGETGDRLRDIAAESEDPELRSAVETAATEVETLSDTIASDPSSLESLDTTAFDDAAATIEERCA